ncbi:SusC/RagA family TonB-linked outer membrane protein [Flavobacterium psychrotrophum]|uniref:SusC/RagA family TonB-linked outer membrane protein n=1 Tax=Flavobacterium psychrotrophum TaxID=2294119 RepID=UPI000E315996|nr:TonB-dependent receptor [Flavobacterium psychrotrophum]
MKLVKLRFFHVICLLCALNMWAQDSVIKGQITDETGLPVPGASIFVKGTQNGTSSDIDGNYQISAGPNATLVISFVGYASQEAIVGGRTSINVQLAPSSEVLEEVVVVGYGTQKKSVVTGAISSVKAKDLENMPLTTVGQSLQGRTSGVYVAQNAGQPGSGATIRVRGVTSFNNNDPLWVVDGVIVDNGGINFLNQSDIESMEVLKDAASQAIYGARAAAGVILITTKKGKSGKLSVNYNGFTGISGPARKIDLLNATQYATLRNEAYANGYNAQLPFQLPYPNAATLGKGTDWQDVIFNDGAKRTQHELSISGGNDKSTFYLSAGITDQEGIVMPSISNYTRKNLRLNSTHKLSKYITVGQNLGYSHEKTIGIGNTNNEFGGPLASAINLDPITPATLTPEQALLAPNKNEYAQQYAVRDGKGNYYGISPTVANEMSNPLAYAKVREGNHGWADNFVGNAYVEVAPIEGLKFRSTLGAKLSYWGSRSFSPYSYLNTNQDNQKQNSLYREMQKGFGWNIENTVSYTKNIDGHNFTVLGGQAAYVDNDSYGQGLTHYNLPVNNYNDASFNFSIPASDKVSWASDGIKHVVTSLFARVNYDYKERYLFTGVIRRDGSSRFGSNNKYGTFPSFSLGWALNKEEFWKENNTVSNLKIRGGYGVVGSDSFGDFKYLALVASGRNYTIGQGDYNVTVGYSPDAPSNPDLKWEETTQANIGFEASIFNDFSLEFDYYKKKTTDILQWVQLPGYVGANGTPFGNVADMQNTGIDVSLTYKKQLGDFNLSVNGNISTLKNKVTSVGEDRKFNSGEGFQSLGSITRYEVGSSWNEFYGYQTNGIFQNQADIDNYKSADGTVIQPGAQPGDFRWTDLNGDGKITDEDRKYLGSPLPKYTYGLTVNLAYKNFDLTLFGQGAGGNKIFQGLRRLDLGTANWQTAALNRWTGEGTSNSYPRISTSDNNKNFTNMSNFYLQKGDYFRIKIVQLGYSLPSDLIGKAGIAKTRVYVTGENLFTFTKYTGFDPEIGGNVSGIDRGYYPQARSFMLGVNLAF